MDNKVQSIKGTPGLGDIDNFKPVVVDGVDTGDTHPAFKIPTYTKTDAEGEATNAAPKTPMDKIPTTSVTPYGKDS